ncbi:hypothetical protein CCHR01_19221 [Colletotrichum chrysophilum]|uniref:Uncharacterized protein n=1 Tax=Colletotrichum chrysophilum TaxID=1836956 RepID=A0AAD8ZYV8_9PEZI|nr:hypothetical protein CCHR01_19221 [Colletotrichum chrysophilum]
MSSPGGTADGSWSLTGQRQHQHQHQHQHFPPHALSDLTPDGQAKRAARLAQPVVVTVADNALLLHAYRGCRSAFSPCGHSPAGAIKEKSLLREG